jgi:hypothetical protein
MASASLPEVIVCPSLLASVFVLSGVLGFILYRGRIVSHWSFDSDLVFIAVPFLSAFIANAYVLFSSSWLRPRTVARLVGLLILVSLSLFFHFGFTWFLQ